MKWCISAEIGRLPPAKMKMRITRPPAQAADVRTAVSNAREVPRLLQRKRGKPAVNFQLIAGGNPLRHGAAV